MTEKQQEQIQKIVAELEENIDFRGADGTYFRRQMLRECLNNGSQSIHTPFALCGDMLGKLNEYIEKDGKSLKDMKIAVLFNVEFVEMLVFDFGVSPENITFFADSISEMMWVQSGYGIGPYEERVFEIGGKIYQYGEDRHNAPAYLEKIVKEKNMKFDCVVMNPPYQNNSGNKGISSLWDKFVDVAIEKLTKEDGFLCAVHPAGWRNGGEVKKRAPQLRKKQMIHLDIHNEADGIKTFNGATTRYDWYILKNSVINQLTTIRDEKGNISSQNLLDFDVIPNFNFDIVKSFLANENEPTVEILANYNYSTLKKHTSQKQNNIFKYPVVYSTSLKGPTVWYSSSNDLGHYTVPKLIFNPSRPLGYFLDINGEYAMSEYCAGIVGDEKYLKMAASIIKDQKKNGFAEFMESCHITNKILNIYVFALFRKDFWKEFV